MTRIIPFPDLYTTCLNVDAIYEGSPENHLRDEPIANLLKGCGNMGGFRIAGRGEDKRIVVLFTTDRIDLNTGEFTSFGDNKTPGQEIHDRQNKMNIVLRQVFKSWHSTPPSPNRITPFLIFTKYLTHHSSQAVQYKGLAVPSFPSMSATEDPVAKWKMTGGQ